jgi:hypothetical protein
LLEGTVRTGGSDSSLPFSAIEKQQCDFPILLKERGEKSVQLLIVAEQFVPGRTGTYQAVQILLEHLCSPYNRSDPQLYFHLLFLFSKTIVKSTPYKKKKKKNGAHKYI